MLELGLGVALAAAAVWFVLRPVLRPEPAADDAAGEAAADPGEDLSPRAVALRGLEELEFDRATGKLSDADYESLRARYTAEALAAPRAEAPGGGSRETGAERLSTPPASRVSSPGYCGRCGAALLADARFCNRCGGRVVA